MPDTLRILMVEDNPADADIAIHALKRAGFVPKWRRVETESDYLSCLDEGPEVILADAHLPQFGGLRALDLLQERGLDIPFLLVSGSLGEDLAVDAMKRGADDYLLKDRLSRLGEAVRRALEQRRLRGETASTNKALHRSEERYRLISEVTSDYAYALCVEENGGFVCEWTTEAFTRLTGFSASEINARGWSSLYDSEDAAAVSRHHKALLSNESDSMEARTVTKSGQIRWVRAYARPIWDAKFGRVVRIYGASQDITTHRDLEQQLRQSQKMEAIGQLAGGVAHDFNNLLTVIIGYGQLLAKSFVSGNPHVEHLDPVLDAAQRASQLTRQLLTFSRRQIFQFKQVNLNLVVTEMEKMLSRMIGEEIELRSSLDPQLGLVRVDPAQMEQVIMNLVVNARDAMSSGGQLTIKTANVTLDESDMSTAIGLQPGPHVTMAVIDTGIGMEAELQARIFEPFFTTKEVGRGTGLGLATAYGIVKQSGGEIRVYSKPGLGSTFEVYFPRLKEEVSMSAPASVAKPSTRGTETILIVEDETVLRKLVVAFLEDHGYTILQTGKPNEALQVAKEYQGKIALLLTDVVLPQMRGPELAAQIVQLRPEIRVLYMSGYTEDAITAHRGLLESGAALLQKPFTPDVFMSSVREALDTPILT